MWYGSSHFDIRGMELFTHFTKEEMLMSYGGQGPAAFLSMGADRILSIMLRNTSGGRALYDRRRTDVPFVGTHGWLDEYKLLWWGRG